MRVCLAPDWGRVHLPAENFGLIVTASSTVKHTQRAQPHWLEPRRGHSGRDVIMLSLCCAAHCLAGAGAELAGK